MSRAAFPLAIGFVLASWLVPRSAQACDLRGDSFHTIDPALQGVDSQPPTLAPIGEVMIHRGHDPESRGCIDSGICGEFLGSFSIAVQATDDIAPAERIGYRVSVASGTPPQGFHMRDPIRANGSLWVWWNDGATGDQEAFDFTLSLVAIDEAGNESAAQTVHIQDGGSGGGCRIGGRRSSTGGVVAAALLAITAAARRRRRGSR
jgi:hypothetical protein